VIDANCIALVVLGEFGVVILMAALAIVMVMLVGMVSHHCLPNPPVRFLSSQGRRGGHRADMGAFLSSGQV
jgi:hypothetical protein